MLNGKPVVEQKTEYCARSQKTKEDFHFTGNKYDQTTNKVGKSYERSG